jgi:hypothetical protein
MWQTGQGEFRIQTTEPEIVRKLSRRKKPNLVAFGVNRYLRVYELSGIRPQNALRTFRCLLGQEIIFNAFTGVYEPKNDSHMNTKKQS